MLAGATLAQGWLWQRVGQGRGCGGHWPYAQLWYKYPRAVYSAPALGAAAAQQVLEGVAEDALDVAAEKGHWVILQVRALRYHGHVTGDGTEPPIAGAPPLWLSSTEPLQTPSYQLLKGCWGPCRLCSEPRWTNKVDPKAELPTGNTSHQLGSTGWAQRGPPGLEAGLFNGVHPGLGQGSSTGSTRA